jgi:hypothetical protein
LLGFFLSSGYSLSIAPIILTSCGLITLPLSQLGSLKSWVG